MICYQAFSIQFCISETPLKLCRIHLSCRWPQSLLTAGWGYMLTTDSVMVFVLVIPVWYTWTLALHLPLISFVYPESRKNIVMHMWTMKCTYSDLCDHYMVRFMALTFGSIAHTETIWLLELRSWLITLLLKVPFTYCWSPSLIPKPSDWDEKIDISGYFFLNEGSRSKFQPSKELANFLKKGPPPVYLGKIIALKGCRTCINVYALTSLSYKLCAEWCIIL